MKFRTATLEDIDNIMKIIEQAKESLKKLRIDQWQKGRPNRETILQDIVNGESFLLEYEKEIIGTVALVKGIDEAYEKIYEGAWSFKMPYCALHRIAVLEKYKKEGVASKLLEGVEREAVQWGLKDLRIDTHPGNFIMQKWIEKQKFLYCGKVDLTDGMRVAYQKILV